MSTTALLALLAGLAGASPAAARGVAPEAWDGPSDASSDLVGLAGTADTDVGGAGAIPAGLPFDALTSLRRDEPGADEQAEPAWRLAVHTRAGWFQSPPLGIGANRDRCDIDAVGAAGDRLTIRYTCSMGRFDWAEKAFLLVCDIDAAGRPACARALLAERVNVHTGGKSDVTTDTVHDTRSCAPTITRTQIALAPTPPDAPADEHHVSALQPCGPAIRLDFAAARPHDPHAPAPLFAQDGRWQAPATAP